MKEAGKLNFLQQNTDPNGIIFERASSALLELKKKMAVIKQDRECHSGTSLEN